MSYFRNMDQPETTDINQHPGYNKLSEARRKEVNTVYENAYHATAARLGVKMASGMAYEAAKKVLEGYGVEKQAEVPKAHTLDTMGFGGQSPADDFEHSAHKQPDQGDPEDEGAREQQVKNHVAKDGTGSIKETEDDGEFKPDEKHCNSDCYKNQEHSVLCMHHPKFDMDENEDEPTHDCPGCGSADHLSFHGYDYGHDRETGYHDAGERFHCQNCGEKGDAEDTLRKPKKLKEGKNHTFDDIEHGDTVHYTTPQGQSGRGKAHIHGDAGWVLRNNSKSGGSGTIVNKKNFKGVTKGKKKEMSGALSALVYGPGGKKKTNEDMEVIDLAASYLTKRSAIKGIMESTEKKKR